MKDEWQGFISFKNLDPNGRTSADSQLAILVHEFLSSQGLRIFFSNVSLETLGVAMYKKAIDAALDQALFLIVIGTSGTNLEQQWVRYEWESFFNDILSGIKPAGRLFAYVDGASVSELPRTIRQSQIFFHGPGQMQRLYNFIANGMNLQPEHPGASEANARSCIEAVLSSGESWAIGPVEVWLSQGGRKPLARISTNWKSVAPAIVEQLQEQGWDGPLHQWGTFSGSPPTVE